MESIMENEQLLVFQKFTNEQLAIELCDLLERNNIESTVIPSPPTDVNFPNNKFGKEFTVKLRKEDFEKADHLLNQISELQLKTINENYYLYGFTDEELIEIVSKPDEWSKLDYLLAQKLLKQRGKEIDAEKLKQQRYNDLAKPEENEKSFIIFGYVIALLGGIFAIFIGSNLMTYKKTLPNGEKIYGYSNEDREHGKRIRALGIIFMVLTAVLMLYILALIYKV